MVSAYFVMVGLGDVGSMKGDVEAGRKANSQFTVGFLDVTEKFTLIRVRRIYSPRKYRG